MAIIVWLKLISIYIIIIVEFFIDINKKLYFSISVFFFIKLFIYVTSQIKEIEREIKIISITVNLHNKTASVFTFSLQAGYIIPVRI